MVQDLRDQYLHIGQTSKSDAIELIGPHDALLEVRSQWCEAYYLGMCSAMSFDGDSLYLCFDKAAILVSSGHIKH